jgi:hypothetical protein
MDFEFVNADTPDFDAETYVRMLIAIAKADKDNGPPEFAYVRNKAVALGLDYEGFAQTTDKDYQLGKKKVSRLTALMILKDAIMLASLDRNFSLPERQRIYAYAQNLDVPRKDVDELENLIQAYRRLNHQWQALVKSV